MSSHSSMTHRHTSVRRAYIGPIRNPTATLIASSLNSKPQEVEPVAGVLGGDSFPSSLVVFLHEWLDQFRVGPLSHLDCIHVRVEIACDSYSQFRLTLRRQFQEMRIWVDSELSKDV